VDDCKDLLPNHFRFVRGVVDSPDIELNVSREMVQQSGQLKAIGANMEKKVIEFLVRMLQEERGTFEKIWREFGKAIKGGVYLERKNAEALRDVLLFPSSFTKGGFVTLKEYEARMLPDQKVIYFAPGSTIDQIERMPQMEAIRDKGVEVLYFVDKVDEFLVQNLGEYSGKKLKSISRGDLDFSWQSGLSKEERDSQASSSVGEAESMEFGRLLERIRVVLKDRVDDVRASKRMKESAACLVSDESGASLNMEQMIRGMSVNPMLPMAKKILEVNLSHPLFRIMGALLDDREHAELLDEYCVLLYSLATLSEGVKIEDPPSFSKSIAGLMSNYLECVRNKNTSMIF
jgi:molecular chaperone HtpG